MDTLSNIFTLLLIIVIIITLLMFLIMIIASKENELHNERKRIANTVLELENEQCDIIGNITKSSQEVALRNSQEDDDNNDDEHMRSLRNMLSKIEKMLSIRGSADTEEKMKMWNRKFDGEISELIGIITRINESDGKSLNESIAKYNETLAGNLSSITLLDTQITNIDSELTKYDNPVYMGTKTIANKISDFLEKRHETQ